MVAKLSDDEWLRQACEFLSKGEHWSVLDLHRARMKWFMSHAPLGYTDGLRRLAWTAVLMNAHILEEAKREVRRMPDAIRSATVHFEKIEAVIGFNRGWFVFVCDDEPRKPVFECYVRSVGGGWNESRGTYALRWEARSVGAIETLMKYGFVLNPVAETELTKLREAVAARAALSRAATADFEVRGLSGGELMPYQKAGVQYITTAKRVLIGDEMGLGKTVQGLAGLQALNAWPALVGTLAIVKDGWVRECQKWLPHVDVYLYEGRTGKPRLFPASVVLDEGQRPALHVVNYDILAHRVQELETIDFQGVVWDEIHVLGNRKSKRTQAVKSLSNRRPVRIGLTGTAVQNRASELTTIIGILGQMDAVGGFSFFMNRYMNARRTKVGKDRYATVFGSPRHLDELHERMRATFYVRRLKREVEDELPESVVTRVPIDLQPAGLAQYKAAAADVAGWMAAKAPLRKEEQERIEAAAPKLRDFVRAQVVAEALERVSDMELLHRLGVLRQVLAIAKRPVVAEWLDHFAEDSKMVLFGHHVEAVRGLAPLLERHKPIIIDGSTPTKERTELVRQFVHDPERRIVLANYIAAGTGLDGLQHGAHHTVHYEWPYTPAKLRQAIARLDRRGQKHTVHQWHLWTPGTVDEESMTLLAEKADEADMVIDGSAEQKAEAFRRARRIGAMVFRI